jgi:hypothetical protein
MNKEALLIKTGLSFFMEDGMVLACILVKNSMAVWLDF